MLQVGLETREPALRRLSAAAADFDDLGELFDGPTGDGGDHVDFVGRGVAALGQSVKVSEKVGHAVLHGDDVAAGVEPASSHLDGATTSQEIRQKAACERSERGPLDAMLLSVPR